MRLPTRFIVALIALLLITGLSVSAFAIGAQNPVGKTQYSASTTTASFYWYNNFLTTGDLFKLKLLDAKLNGGKYLNFYGGTGATSVFSVGEQGAILTAGTITQTLTNAASGSANPYDYTATLGIMNGSDDFTLFDVNITNADHTGSNTVQVIDIAAITGDAHAVETAVNIGSGWDTGITSASAVAFNAGITCDSTAFTVADTSGNVGTTGTLTAGGVSALNGGITVDTSAFTVADTTGNVATTGTLSVDGVALIDKFQYGATLANTDGSETLTAAQTGLIVTASKADGTTTVTLPDPAAGTVGVVYEIYQTADQVLDVVPTTADGNSIVALNVATSDKVSLSTAGEKIGGGIRIVGISATKWAAFAIGSATLSVEAAD